MFSGKRILAVVPARGGSKGLLHKNLRPMRGVPLVVHAARVAAEVTEIDRSVVSTDDEEIARVARAAGLALNGFRPAALSGDRVPDWPVLHHELLAAEAADNVIYDVVIMLQPTCPLRKPSHVLRALQTLVLKDLDAVWTISPSDPKFHPLKQLVLGDDQLFDYFDKGGGRIVARQELSPLYHRNGAAYAITRGCLVEQKSIKGARAGAVVVDEPLVSIDTAADLRLCEFYAAEEAATGRSQ